MFDAMLRLCVFSLCLVFCFVVKTQSAALGNEDLYEEEGDFAFVYHAYQALFLTIHQKSSCYFYHVVDYVNMNDDPVRGYVKRKAKEAILNPQNNNSTIHSSDLSAIRDRYEDRLADFHCLDKQIYTLNLTVPQFTCEGKERDKYPDPLVCFRYYLCLGPDTGYNFVCGQGTSYDQLRQTCRPGSCQQ